MAATLTSGNGYLIYTIEGKIVEIPYSLLSICTIIKDTEKVSIILPSETNAHIKSFIDIYPTAALTTVDAVETYLKSAQAQSSANTDYAIEIQTDATYTYIAYAAPASALSSAVWKAKKVTTATGVTKWADGNANFDNVATTLSGLNYL